MKLLKQLNLKYLLFGIVMFWMSISVVSLASNDETWTPEDFTYVEYSKLLYGCDYSRQFTVSGKAISGFSELGEEKLLSNKDLVIPSTDIQGEMIVGVADNAFKNKGLTSVKFPTGMMVDYDDTVTNVITKRGNFVIAESAFAGNELTSVNLPEGVIACLSYAFNNNKIETVKLPKTIWWLETMCFANNRIKTVNFPTICDFQMEMHGLTFAKNFIETVRLPDYTEVVNKDAFLWNVGKEPIASDAKETYKTYTVDGITYNTGIVYMYTDNEALLSKDRIHHTDRSTASQKSYSQKLILNDGTNDTQYSEQMWTVSDFTYSGTTITGLSESGILKRAKNKDLVLPDKNPNGEYITHIAFAEPSGYGLFAVEGEGFDSVYLPSKLEVIGDYAFQNNGIKEVTFPSKLKEIGKVAFQTNNLTSVILPDSVTELGVGAFATNPLLERINLSKGLTEIPEAAFGCSDNKHYMTKLTSIKLHDGITSIGRRAFAGNNFKEIVIPDSVKSIGDYAFSTKNYLNTPCTVELPEGLEIIGDYAFRNKVISDILIPSTVQYIKENTFCKEYSDGTQGVVTQVYVTLKSQYEDTVNFPSSEYHQVCMAEDNHWTVEDFVYGEQENTWVVTGLSEAGQRKIKINKKLTIPQQDSEGKPILGIGTKAFYDCGITSLEISEGITYIGERALANNAIEELVFPKSIETIGESAFSGNRITVLEFPAMSDEALWIGQSAFASNCIKAIQIPSNTERVAADAFANNTGIDKISEDSGLVYMYQDAKEAGEYIAYKSAGSSEVQELILGKLIEWGKHDFTYDEATGTLTGWSESGQEKRKTMKNLVLPNQTPSGKNIIAIGDAAFKIPDDEVIVTKFGIDSPEGMQTVDLPVHLKTVGKEAFAQNALTRVDLGTVTDIGESAFYGNDLIQVIIPDTVTKLGDGAFATNDITELVLPKNLTVIPQGAFSMNIRMERVVIPEKVTEIRATAFAGARLTKLTIPKNVKKIGEKAFHLHHLTELTIPGNVKEIGDSAFEGTFKATTLKKLVIEEGVERIGKYAFKEALLETVHFPLSLKTIGEKPFQNNKGKNDSQVVEVTSYSANHLSMKDSTFIVKYKGSYDIAKMALKMPYTTITYNGKEMKPKVVISGLTEGIHFAVAYSGNKYPGKATVTVTGKAPFKGVVKKAFTINAPKVSAPTTVSANLYGYDDLIAKWSGPKVAGATVKYKVEYKVYKGKWKKLSSGTTATSIKKANLSDGKKYCFRVTPYVTINKRTYNGTSKTSSYVYTLKKLSTPKVAKSGSGVKVTWKNISGETGYQISQSTSKKKTKIVKTVNSTSTKSVKITAKKKKTYYYKVRSYKTVAGKTIYGPWSSVKKYKRK